MGVWTAAFLGLGRVVRCAFKAALGVGIGSAGGLGSWNSRCMSEGLEVIMYALVVLHRVLILRALVLVMRIGYVSWNRGLVQKVMTTPKSSRRTLNTESLRKVLVPIPPCRIHDQLTSIRCNSDTTLPYQAMLSKNEYQGRPFGP